MNYIGMDVHISSVDIAVANSKGDIKQRVKVELSMKEIMEFVQNVRKPRRTFIEECTLAGWLLESFTHFGEELVITDPRQNKWIGNSDQKSDPIDAFKLAKLAWGKYVKEIHHPIGDRRQFRELVIAYHDTVKNLTRIKNKIKAKFRQHGIACSGSTVYSSSHRELWISKLSDETAQFIVEGFWQELDAFETIKDMYLERIRKQSQRYPEIKLFMTVPGIAMIHASTISAMLETPDRFSRRTKVWKYAGFGLVKKSSGKSLYVVKRSNDYNRYLKNAIKKAVEVATQFGDNPYGRKYARLTLEMGMSRERAKVIVARSMLTTLYYMWQRKEKFDPERDLKQSGENNIENPSMSPP